MGLIFQGIDMDHSYSNNVKSLQVIHKFYNKQGLKDQHLLLMLNMDLMYEEGYLHGKRDLVDLKVNRHKLHP